MNPNQKDLLSRIRTRGWNEQEKQYLFPSLYGRKAVTKNTIGIFVTFDRQLKRGKYSPYSTKLAKF